MTEPIATKVSIEINAPLARVFTAAVPVDIPTIMPARGLLPGVARVEDQTGAWDGAGQSRRIILTDGSAVDERITNYAKDDFFTYEVTGFAFPLGALALRANGEWRFTAMSDTLTRIDWTYAFTPRGGLAAHLLGFFVRQLWHDFIDDALTRVKHIVETEPAEPSAS